MNTSAKNKKTSIQKGSISIAEIPGVEFKKLPIAEIDFSPFNYRKFFPPQSLEEFAGEILQHGIISPITVRPLSNGRYELVAGERRTKAALLAGLTEIPATIQNLTDEAVIEIQLAENLQREDTHPMHEAQAIGKMQEAGKSLEEIATRLGKSKKFIYSRLKLLSLTTAFHEMILSNKISLTEAINIATLSKESQDEFFEEYCKNWQKEKNFNLPNFKFCLARYKYDLKAAPFNTKDENLIPEVGACTKCPFNSGTLKTLFPELAKEAVCTNQTCFANKCSAQLTVDLAKSFYQYQPMALIIDRPPTDRVRHTIQSVPALVGLVQYNQTEIDLMTMPEPPCKEDYSNEWDIEEGQTPEFDEEGYNDAFQEYESELEEYNHEITSGNAAKGLFLNGNKVELVYFSTVKRSNTNHNGQATAKEVQAAIKSGKASPALLEAEIERLENKEARAQQLDREKIQLAIHGQFSQQVNQPEHHEILTTADLAAARLLIYHSLDCQTRNEISRQLLPKENEEENDDQLFDMLSRLTDQQYSFLIRAAVASKPESKNPYGEMGYCLLKVAEGVGINISSITEAQQGKATERQKKQKARTEELEKKIAKMKIPD